MITTGMGKLALGLGCPLFFVTFSILLYDLSASRVHISDEPTQKWKYVTVRPDAHMFWWTYFTTAAAGYELTPLVLWLQGGPGGSSAGFGNFEEIGPLDINLQRRNTTWLSAISLLFIDNPVGAGFSYTTADSAFTTDVQQIAADLLTVIKAVFSDVPQYQTVPFYIFSESYGGKMTAAFGAVLSKAISFGAVKCNFKGIAMGDSWISPIDSVLTWAPYLYATSVVDAAGAEAIGKYANATAAAVSAGEFEKATELWAQTEDVVGKATGGVNFYNILQWAPTSGARRQDRSSYRHLRFMQSEDLTTLMNGPIRHKLAIIPDNVTWAGQSSKVFEKQKGDFMRPVIDIVDDLLAEDKLNVVVYNGQLDLIVDTLSAERWVQRLQWTGLRGFDTAPRQPLSTDHRRAAFRKVYKRFSFYWVLSAGHMIPKDVPEVAFEMMKMITTEA